MFAQFAAALAVLTAVGGMAAAQTPGRPGQSQTQRYHPPHGPRPGWPPVYRPYPPPWWGYRPPVVYPVPVYRPPYWGGWYNYPPVYRPWYPSPWSW